MKKSKANKPWVLYFVGGQSSNDSASNPYKRRFKTEESACRSLANDSYASEEVRIAFEEKRFNDVIRIYSSMAFHVTLKLLK